MQTIRKERLSEPEEIGRIPTGDQDGRGKGLLVEVTAQEKPEASLDERILVWLDLGFMAGRARKGTWSWIGRP